MNVRLDTKNHESESGFESGAKKVSGYIPAAVHQTTATTSQPHLVTHAQEARGKSLKKH